MGFATDVRGLEGEPSLRWSELLDSCAARLTEAGLPTSRPFALRRFADAVAERRGRPLRLIPVHLRPDADSTVCGLCVGGPRTDHVFYTETLCFLHTTHNLVHELAHLVFGHRHVMPLPRATADRVWPPRPPSAESLFGLIGPSYDRVAEWEADAAAAVLLGRHRDPPPVRWAGGARLKAGARRLSEVLG